MAAAASRLLAAGGVVVTRPGGVGVTGVLAGVGGAESAAGPIAAGAGGRVA